MQQIQDISVSLPDVPGCLWPQRLGIEGPSYEIFHRKDDRFLQPKTLVAFNVHCPRTSQDALRHLLTTIWCSCIEEELNEFAYDASQAGLEHSLDVSGTGMSLTVAGFSDKLPVLLEAVVARMGKAVSSTSFDIVLDRYQRHLRNVALKQRPCDLAIRKSGELTRRDRFSTEEMLAVIDQVRLEDVQSEHQRLFGDAFFETLVTGHASATEAQQLAAQLAPLVPSGHGRAAEDPEEAELPEGQTLWIIPGTNPEERNSCVLMELQLPGNLQGSVFTALLVRMLNPKVFEDLRTKQQLGYIVQLSNMEGRRFQKLRLLVQTEFEAPEVRARIERCWKRQLQWVLEEMDEAEFQRQKQGLGSLLAEAPKNLNEEFARFWVEVTRRRYDFQRRQKKLELLRAAELQAFKDFVAKLDAAPRLFIEIHSQQRSKQLSETLTPSAADRVWNGMEALQTFRSRAKWRETEPIAAKLAELTNHVLQCGFPVGVFPRSLTSQLFRCDFPAMSKHRPNLPCLVGAWRRPPNDLQDRTYQVCNWARTTLFRSSEANLRYKLHLSYGIGFRQGRRLPDSMRPQQKCFCNEGDFYDWILTPKSQRAWIRSIQREPVNLNVRLGVMV
eukprot:s50_g20.t1